MQKVKLLAICGSPRPTGNSRYLLDQAVEEALEVGEDYVEDSRLDAVTQRERADQAGEDELTS